MTAYRVLRGPEAGKTVYKLAKFDYGLASDDTRYTGVEHTSVTFDPAGDYPSFTIPVRDMEEIKEVPRG